LNGLLLINDTGLASVYVNESYTLMHHNDSLMRVFFCGFFLCVVFCCQFVKSYVFNKCIY